LSTSFEVGHLGEMRVSLSLTNEMHARHALSDACKRCTFFFFYPSFFSPLLSKLVGQAGTVLGYSVDVYRSCVCPSYTFQP
jgi:hypothetical protein